MALTPEQEAQIIAHLNNKSNPHVLTMSQVGLTSTDNLPEGHINLYSRSTVSIIVPINDWFPDAVSVGYIITPGTDFKINVSETGTVASGTSYAWLGGHQFYYPDETDFIDIAAPDATDRTDLVYLDPSYALEDYKLVPWMQTGDTNVPANCIALYEIFVPSTATSAADCTFTDKRLMVQEINVQTMLQYMNTTEQYRDEAYDWAEEDEDIQVTDSAGHTGYSAYHWSKKAQAIVGDSLSTIAGDTGNSDYLSNLDFERDATEHIRLTKSFIIDEDDMASDDDTKVPTQQSVKAFVDSKVSGEALDKATYDPQNIAADAFDRSNQTGTQPANTIDDFDDEVENNPTVVLNTAHRNSPHAPSDATKNASDAYLLDLGNHTGTITADKVSDFDIEVGNHPDVQANTAQRHSHSNKDVLDDIEVAFTTAKDDLLDGAVQYDDDEIATAEWVKTSSDTDETSDVTIPTVKKVKDMINDNLGTEVSFGQAVSNKVVALTDGVIDCSAGNYYWLEITADTTFSFNNTISGYYIFVLELTNAGAQTITWPTTVKWEDGTAPTLTTAGVDILTFFTRDSGTTWFGKLSSAYPD